MKKLITPLVTLGLVATTLFAAVPSFAATRPEQVKKVTVVRKMVVRKSAGKVARKIRRKERLFMRRVRAMRAMRHFRRHHHKF